MRTAQSTFTVDLCGGYGSPTNPQFSLKVKRDNKYSITVRAHTETACGLIFWVNENNQEGCRLLSLNSSEAPEVARSPYIITKEIENLVDLKCGKEYVITPCLQNPNQACDVEVELVDDDNSVEYLRALNLNRVVNIASSWRANLNGGRMSLMNPQFELSWDGTDPTKFMTVVRRKDKGNDTGIMFFVIPSGRKGGRRKQFEKNEVLFESTYLLSHQISGTFTLSTSGSYIIIPCLQSGAFVDFDVVVESNCNDFSVVELTLEEKPLPKELSCIDILKDTKYKGTFTGKPDSHLGSDNKILYYDANPVDDIIEYCTRNECKFVDPFFPPNEESVNMDDGRQKKLLSYEKWQRTADFLDDPQVYVDGISIEDICQGYLGNCWFCQGMASLAKRPELVISLIYPKSYSERGVYSVKLFIQGEWRYVVVDDYIPTSGGSPQFASSKDRNELWPMLLEKAFAKTFGSYRALTARDPAIALKRLTGGATEHITLPEQFQKDNGEALWQQLKVYTKFNWIMGLVTKPSIDNEKQCGMVSYHAYSLLRCKEVPTAKGLVKLCSIRNTWGRSEWTGKWSDSDTSGTWTPEIKELVGFEDKDDGIFWMEWSDVREYFRSIYLCKLYDDTLPYFQVINGRWPSDGGGYKNRSNPSVFIRTTQRNTKLLITFYRTAPENLSCGLIGLVCTADDPPSSYSYYSENYIIAETKYYISDQVSVEVQLKETERSPNVYRLVPCLEKAGVLNAQFKITINCDHPIQILSS